MLHKAAAETAVAPLTPTFQFPPRLRAFVRARETSVTLIAAAVGVMAGLVVSAMSAAVTLMHALLFNIQLGDRLSAEAVIQPIRAIVPMVGGLLFGLSLMLLARWRPGGEVDPIEANALHGGRMSFRGSVIVALQTIWSSGVGASVGLEAGYTQLSSGIASWFGRKLNLRRNDQRLLVGCGAAAAIAGAFGAPLAGAFYGFELIIGGYTAAGLAPVGIASLNSYLIVRWLTPLQLGIITGSSGTISARDMVIASVFGVATALFGICVMRGVALWERFNTSIRLPLALRPAIGGIIVGGLALLSPQVLSSGHGALHMTAYMEMPLTLIGLIFVLKTIASIVSLGSGFRGGLFFASLLLGALGGRLFAAAVNGIIPGALLDPNIYAVLGMGALSAAVIGGPLTMTFIVLESTGDLWLTTAVLIAVIIASQLTRETFGYSFATWRFHLRGETIRSAADVGWIRDLSVGRMMRPDVSTVPQDISVDDFRRLYPLGSTSRVVAVDEKGGYAGIVEVPDVHGLEDSKIETIATMLHHKDEVLVPNMNVKEAARTFDRAEAETLAVVDSLAEKRVLGILTEAYTLRRYAEESERRRSELLGEG